MTTSNFDLYTGSTLVKGLSLLLLGKKKSREREKACIQDQSCSLSFVLKRRTTALRAQLYGLGYPRQPSPRATLAEVTFSLFLSKIQPAVYIRIANSSRGARQLGWASCLTSAGRVTLASGTTFLHINALARLTGTSLGVANVT